MESRGRTSGEQFATLLEFMESHGDITRPQPGAQGRARADRLWQELASMLNSVGGGIQKTPDKWKKVWADWKSKTKKKALTIRRHASGTGGGPRILLSLTTFEARLLEIMGAVAVEGQRNVEEQGFNNSQAIPLLETTNDDTENGPASPPSWAPSPELTPQTHPPSTNHERAQASTSREQFQASTTPTRPRLTRRPQLSPLFSATSPYRPAMRPRRRRALTPFDRATSEFVAVEQRRLALEELRESNNSRRIETDVERTSVLSRFADLSQTWLQNRESNNSRRIETNIERTSVMSRFADLAQTWLQHYLARDNTEPLNNSE